jgi:hypothetical protein
MRIILAGPPKTGNVWVENILARVYGLHPQVPVPPYHFWGARDVVDLQRLVDDGGFADGAIFHQHYWPTEAFLALAAEIPCHLVSVVRHPYDTFVSLYFYIQNFTDAFRAVGASDVQIIGKPIDHPDVLDFLATGFRIHLLQANAWVQSGRSRVVRYEELHRDPVTAIRRLADGIQPVPGDRITDALVASDASRMRQQSVWLARHIRQGAVGDWRNHLSAPHLEIFRTVLADLVVALGYAVR